MGTTLTAVYVGEREVAIAHVGDSRAYRLRDGELLRLTDDHSLVDELLRQGRLTPEEAVEHPQRSVITRALGPEGAVEVDTRSYARARRRRVPALQRRADDDARRGAPRRAAAARTPTLRDAGEALIAAANEAGGRDNITVVLLRLEELDAGAAPPTEEAPAAVAPATAPTPRHGRDGSPRRSALAAAPARGRPPPVVARRPRLPAPAPPARRRRRCACVAPERWRSCRGVLALIGAGRLPGAAVGVLHRHERPRAGDGVPRRARTPAGRPRAVQQRLRLGRERLDAHAGSAASTLLDHSLRSEGERGLADPQPRTRAARMRACAMNQPIVRLFGRRARDVRAAARVHLALDGLRSLLAARQPAQRARAARAAADRPRPDPRGRRHGARAQRALAASRSESIYERTLSRRATSSRTRSATTSPRSAAPGWSASATRR